MQNPQVQPQVPAFQTPTGAPLQPPPPPAPLNPMVNNLPRRAAGAQMPVQPAQAPIDPVALQASAALAQEVLLKVSTVFPFTLFPDTLTIDRMKATITQRMFFGHTQVQSIQIEDILNVTASCGPLFGQLRIWTRFFTDRPLVIKYLKRPDAMTAKQVLQGYSIARHQKVATANLGKDQLLPLILKLGEAAGE